jgi:glutamyl/glutaminyl-tRNA synthetase
MNYHKTRFAPTPSGYLHLGNIFSFAVTAAIARKTQANILLRIDDMDTQRSNPLFISDIFDCLIFLNLPWQEGPKDVGELVEKYSQQKRTHLYKKALDQLRSDGMIYACDCSRSMLQARNAFTCVSGCRDKTLSTEAPEVSWRLKTGEELIRMKGSDGTTLTTRLPEQMKDFVVRRRDGFAGYQLCSVIDDGQFEIDLVVRGEDLLTSSLAQLYLASKINADNFLNATFHHHRLLTNEAGLKLSKSAGDTSLKFLITQGHTAEDIYEMISKKAGLQPCRSWQELEEAISI